VREITQVDQGVINLIGGAVLAALGWFARVLYDDVREMQKKHAELREHIAENYARKVDVENAVNRMHDSMTDLSREVRAGFDKIFEKLDSKADKDR